MRHGGTKGLGFRAMDLRSSSGPPIVSVETATIITSARSHAQPSARSVPASSTALNGHALLGQDGDRIAARLAVAVAVDVTAVAVL